MKDKDHKMLQEAYSKIYIKESTVPDSTYIEMGEGGLNPREGSDDIARASVIEVDGVKYAVSAFINVNTEHEYNPGDRAVGLGASFDLKNDIDIDYNGMGCGLYINIINKYGQEGETVYELSNGKVVKDDIQNPKVVQFAYAEVEKRIEKDLYENPEKYDTDKSAHDHNPDDDRDWEED